MSDGPVYALNLFNIASRDEYLAYSRRSAREVAAHGGRVVALGRFRENITGDVTPRQVLILVERCVPAPLVTVAVCSTQIRTWRGVTHQ